MIKYLYSTSYLKVQRCLHKKSIKIYTVINIFKTTMRTIKIRLNIMIY